VARAASGGPEAQALTSFADLLSRLPPELIKPGGSRSLLTGPQRRSWRCPPDHLWVLSGCCLSPCP
jgi:hypothetical protein